MILHAVNRKCPICREFHAAPSEAAYVRMVDACRDKFIGSLVRREYINELNAPARGINEAETVVRPVVVS